MKHHLYHAAVLVLCAVSLGACAAETGRPSSVTSTQPSMNGTPSVPSEGLPHSGAPKVEKPLPASALSGDPCVDALTPAQVKEVFGKDITGKPEELPIGPQCSWSNLSTGAQLLVVYSSELGLSASYQNTQPQSEVWRELPSIQGFPAVAFRSKGGLPNQCTTSVGLADNMAVDVSLILGDTRDNATDPCDVISQIAGMTVTTLREKAEA